MYRCFITGKLSKPGEKPHKLVIETRDRTYYGWVHNEETEQLEHLPVGKGWEIVKEVNVSDEGLKLWQEANTVKE